MKIYIIIKGDNVYKSTYIFCDTSLEKLTKSDSVLFGISSQLISIPSLKNIPENINSKQITVKIINDNIEKMLKSVDLKQAGIDLLRNEFIKKYRIQ